MGFCKEYGWTLEEVENTALEDLLDMTAIKSAVESGVEHKFIDDIL